MTEWTRGSVQGATWEPSGGLRGEAAHSPGARSAHHPPGLQLSPGPTWLLGSGSRARALTHLAKLTSHILLRSPTFCQARAWTPRGGGGPRAPQGPHFEFRRTREGEIGGRELEMEGETQGKLRGHRQWEGQ